MGKVHGSLARAGKVKGQTPKIDKIEKKKQPRGRCVRLPLWFRGWLLRVPLSRQQAVWGLGLGQQRLLFVVMLAFKRER